MEIVLWVLAVVLAVAVIGAGVMKLTRSQDQLVAAGMGALGDVPARLVTVIGALEVLGGLGLVLPPLVGVATALTPLAALGLAVILGGAVVVHVRRRDPAQAVVPPAVLLVAALVVAWGRFGPYAF